MRVAIDAMGGDFAPAETCAGALVAANSLDADLSLVGEPDALRAHLGDGHPSIDIVPAHDVIEMEESPRRALRGRDDTSVARAVQLVADGSAQGVVSAGNSGAFMALAALRMGTVPGLSRPAIAINFPTPTGRQVLLDGGANADCKPEYLRDFALMGSLYAQYGLGIDNPRVGLMSVGEEKGKGNELTKAAYPLIEAVDVNFLGNIEGTDAFTDSCDVVVCDGFVGNVILKTAERAAELVYEALIGEVERTPALREVAAPFREALRRSADSFSAAEAGGAILLGVNGAAVVCHGAADGNQIYNGVRLAHRVVEHKLVEHLVEVFAGSGDATA